MSDVDDEYRKRLDSVTSMSELKTFIQEWKKQSNESVEVKTLIKDKYKIIREKYREMKAQLDEEEMALNEIEHMMAGKKSVNPYEAIFERVAQEPRVRGARYRLATDRVPEIDPTAPVPVKKSFRWW